MDDYFQPEADERALQEREADEFMARLIGNVPDPFVARLIGQVPEFKKEKVK